MTRDIKRLTNLAGTRCRLGPTRPSTTLRVSDGHELRFAATQPLDPPTVTMSTASAERQPLLPPTVLLSDAQVHERLPLRDEEATTPQQPEIAAAVDGPGQDEVVQAKKKTRGEIAWRIVLWVLGAFLLALFIKGFVDADDVEVRLSLV